MKILLHICCGPCTVYPLDALREEGHDIRGFFYNPNIHPYIEFKKRVETIEAFASDRHLPLHVDKSYDLETFLKGALEQGEARCLFCYRMRLERAFHNAKEKGFEAISTTLLYSKYQRHDEIAAIGRDLANIHGIAFLYRDFRLGWKQGQDESVRLNMYRQKYCGCIFSERDRFYRKHKP